MLTLVGACYTTLAQPTSIQLDWQVSADNGATWLGGDIQVPEHQSSVLVRLRAEWENHDPGVYFASTRFDAMLRTPERESADAIDMFHVASDFRWTALINPNGLASTRFGDTLKVDDIRDTSPPGMGSRWVTAFQYDPMIGILHPENPTIVFSYRLVLDGAPGARLVSGVFLPYTNTPPNYLAALYMNPFLGMTTAVPTIIRDASVTVVPAPGAVLFVVAAMGVLMRRR